MKKTTLFALALFLMAAPAMARETESGKKGRGLDERRVEVRHEFKINRGTSTVAVSSSTRANLNLLRKNYQTKLETIRKTYLEAKKKAETDKKAAIRALNDSQKASSTALRLDRKEDFKRAEQDFKKGRELLKQASSTATSTFKDLIRKRNEDYKKSQSDHLKNTQALNLQISTARKAILDKFQADMKAAKVAFEAAVKAAKAEFEAARK